MSHNVLEHSIRYIADKQIMLRMAIRHKGQKNFFFANNIKEIKIRGFSVHKLHSWY